MEENQCDVEEFDISEEVPIIFNSDIDYTIPREFLEIKKVQSSFHMSATDIEEGKEEIQEIHHLVAHPSPSAKQRKRKCELVQNSLIFEENGMGLEEEDEEEKKLPVEEEKGASGF